MYKIIGHLHLLLLLHQVLYPLLFSANRLGDKIYIALSIIILLNWILFKGECYISYLYKKMKDPSYVMGSNVLDLADMKHVFGFITPKFTEIFFLVLQIIFYAPLIYYINYRSQLLGSPEIFAFIFFQIFTLLRLRKYYNKDLFAFMEKYNMNYAINLFIIIFLLYLLIKLFIIKK